jgi:acetylornithine/succinyldiaminopimelate/putrescine aminotransferase
LLTDLPSQDQLLADFENYVSAGRANFYKSIGLPLFPGKREGVRIYNLDGKPYINCRSSGGVFNLGHRPPQIIDALKHALDELDMGDHLLMSAWRARLAKKLAELTPGDLQVTTFVPGGGEAIDVSLKLARAYTGRTQVIYAREGYHGHTGLALSATTDEFKKRFEPLVPGFIPVPFGDSDALEARMNDHTAAVIFETIPATGGILIPLPDFYPRVRELCDEVGALLIIDEVQTGLARTGRMWAIDEWNVVPDFLVMGKGTSAAVYPISATTYKKKIDEFFADNPFYHLSSYAGSDLGCVVAYTMLEIITAPGFIENVQARGEQFARGLANLREKYPRVVKDVRQRGLMIGIELASDMQGMLFTLALAHNGVLANYAGARPNTQIIMPPLIINAEDTALVLNALDRSLAALESG